MFPPSGGTLVMRWVAGEAGCRLVVYLMHRSALGPAGSELLLPQREDREEMSSLCPIAFAAGVPLPSGSGEPSSAQIQGGTLTVFRSS
jgi:hypothetical protein